MEPQHGPVTTRDGDRRRNDAVNRVLHAIQRRHPATAPVRSAWRPRRIWFATSPVGGQYLRKKCHEYGLHHGHLRDLAGRVRRPTWCDATIRRPAGRAEVIRFTEAVEQ